MKTGIAWIITQEALLISFFGVVAGVLAAILLRFALRQTASVSFDLNEILLTLVGVLIGGVIGALYPAIRAARGWLSKGASWPGTIIPSNAFIKFCEYL